MIPEAAVIGCLLCVSSLLGHFRCELPGADITTEATAIMSSDNYKAYVAIPMHIFSSEEAAAAPSASFRRERVRALCSRDGYLVPKIIAAILVAILIVVLLPLWMRRASS
jgi:hypothetical protein